MHNEYIPGHFSRIDYTLGNIKAVLMEIVFAFIALRPYLILGKFCIPRITIRKPVNAVNRKRQNWLNAFRLLLVCQNLYSSTPSSPSCVWNIAMLVSQDSNVNPYGTPADTFANCVEKPTKLCWWGERGVRNSKESRTLARESILESQIRIKNHWKWRQNPKMIQ